MKKHCYILCQKNKINTIHTPYINNRIIKLQSINLKTNNKITSYKN